MPLANIKYPANAAQYNKVMIEIAIFDILPDDLLLGNVYFPQEDNFNINFQEIGYESIYAVPNLGTVFFMFLTFLILVPIGWCLKFFA